VCERERERERERMLYIYEIDLLAMHECVPELDWSVLSLSLNSIAVICMRSFW
jgi:hypothetical protein